MPVFDQPTSASNPYFVRFTLVLYGPCSWATLLAVFQSTLDSRQRFLQIRSTSSHRVAADDRALEAGQSRLLRSHDHDEVKTGLLWIVAADAICKVQCSLEVVTGVNLFFTDRVSRFVRIVSLHGHNVHHTQCRLKTKFHIFPIKHIFHVWGLAIGILKKIVVVVR